jgi:hypothetical protein
MGVRQALFPVPTLGAHLAVAAGFPTLFSTASGVSGLVAGPSNVSQRWISSEAFQLAWAGGCATGLQTRWRHDCDFVSASSPLDAGRPSLLAVRWPASRVSPLNSQVAFRSQASGVVFNIAGSRKVFTGPAQPACPSRNVRSLCFTFRWFSLGGFKRLIEPARVARPVLIHSSNRIPSG